MVTEGDEMTNEEIIAEMEKKYHWLFDYCFFQQLSEALDKARAEGEVKGNLEQAKHYEKFILEAEERGRQSAQKEIDDLKLELERKEHLIDKWIAECGKKDAEKQEQVRKLKDYFYKVISGTREYTDKKVDSFFPDCADN